MNAPKPDHKYVFAGPGSLSFFVKNKTIPIIGIKIERTIRIGFADFIIINF